MNQDPRLSYRSSSGSPLTPPSAFTRVVAFSLGALVIGTAMAAALMFSLILLPVILLVGTAGVGYVWFKSRHVRRQLSAQMQAMRESLARQQTGGPGASRPDNVIDGDFIQEAEPRNRPRNGQDDPDTGGAKRR